MNRAPVRAVVILLVMLVTLFTASNAHASVATGAAASPRAPAAQGAADKSEVVRLPYIRASSSAFAARASVSPQVQFLNDTAGTVFTFTIRNSGTSQSLGAVEIGRPSNQWKIVACPQAPPGWTAERSDTKCRFRSAATTADDIPPGQVSSAFQVKATTTAGNANRVGLWEVLVSRSNQLDAASTSFAFPEAPGLGIVVYAWQILDALVDATPRAPGSACPAATPANHSALTGSTGQKVVICGRNRMNVAATPRAALSSLGGSFIAAPGSFSSGSIARNSASSVVLGTWSNVTITSSAGAGKRIVALIGSSIVQFSPITTLNGYEAKNLPPAAAADSYTVDEDGSLGVPAPGVLSNDSDPDGDPLTAVLATTTAHGALTLNAAGSFTYTPAANYSGPDSFTYRARDQSGAESAPATVSITVNPVGDAPAASAQSVSTAEDSALTITLAGSDADGDSLTFAIATGPTSGSLGALGAPSCAAGSCTASVTYTPNPDYSGPDSFTFTVSDGATTSAPATVSITVGAADDAPVAVDDSATVAEDAGATAIDVLANDTDGDGGPISIASVTQPANGAVVITGGGTGLTYQPDAGYCAATPDSFTYTLAPGGSTATVSVTVTCVDDAPVAVDDSATVLEDAGATAVDVLANDTDGDGGPISIASVTQPANGTVVITGGGTGLTYQPDADYCAATPDSFTYTLAPGGSTATVEVAVTCVNDAPSFDLPASPDQTVALDAGPQSVAGFASNISAGPANEAGQALTFAVTSDNTALFAAQPAISAATGTLTYTPATGQTGSATVSVALSDDGGTANGGADTSATKTFQISVRSPNADPVVTPATFALDENSANGMSVGSVVANDPDAGQTLTLAITAGNTGGAFAIDPGTGEISVADSAALDYETTPSFALTVTATDNGAPPASGSATITINLNDLNEQPTAIALSNASVDEGQPAGTAVGTLSTTDQDAGDTHAYTLVAGAGDADNGAFRISGNTLETDETFDFETKSSYSIRVRSTDSGGLFFEQQFTIDVGDGNDAPVAVNDSYNTVEGSPLTIAAPGVLGNDSDPEGAALTAVLVAGPSNAASFTLHADGSFRHTPNAGATSDSFTYRASDGALESNLATVTIGINTRPTASAQSVSTDEDTPLLITLSGSDGEDAGLTFAIATGPGNGGLGAIGAPDCSALNTCTASVTYTPNANYSGPDSFTFTVGDGATTSAPATVSITVNPVNDAPVLANIEGAALGYTEGGAPVALTGSITVSDADSATLSGATVTIGAGYQSGADVLAFANQLGITGSFDGGSGVLTLAGSASPADYQTALRAVTYANTGEAPSAGGRTISFKVNDGAADSNVVSRQVNVTAVNDAPVNTVPGAQTVNEDTNLVFSAANGNAISVADVDAGAGAIQVTLSSPNATITAAAGSGATLTGNGTQGMTIVGTLAQVNAALNGLTYRGIANFNSTRGATTLTITTDDQGNTGTPGAQSDSDTIAITISAVNDAPAAAAQSYGPNSLQANMRRSIGSISGLLVGASDPDTGDGGYTATFSVGSVNGVTPTAGTINTTIGGVGTVSVNASTGAFDFDPAPGVTGNVSFSYTICDSGNPGPAACSGAATVSFNISGPVIWFVDDSAPAGGDGRLSSPFNTLAAADAVDASSHRIFLYAGTYATGITLNTSEWLIGQGATNAPTNTFDALFGITPPAGTLTRPAIGTGTATIQGTVTLASGASVKGLAITTSGATQGMAGSGGLTGVSVDQVAISTATGTALALNNVAGSLAFTSVSANGAPAGIDLTNVGATVTIGGGAIQNTTTAGVSLSGGAGNFSYAGTLANTAGRTVLVQSRTGGTATFSGAITGGGTGMQLNANTGATISFTSGALALSTGANPAFTATSGGTVNVTGAANTLATTTATALNVQNTTIGASDLVFRSINSTGASNNAGVILINTGTAGGLTVTGTGAADSGGTIANKGGADIQSGSPPAPTGATNGVAFYLSNTAQVSLTSMRLQNFSNHAIFGARVTDFTLASSTVDGANGDSNANDEGSLYLQNGAGTYTISASNISGGLEDNLRAWYDSATATTAVWNVSNTTFRDLQTTGGNAQVNLGSTTAASASSNVTWNFTGSTFENDARTLPPGGTENWSDGILITFSGPFQHAVNIQNSTFHHLFQGLDMASDFNADVNYTIRNNNITFTEGVAAIAFGTGSNSTPSSSVTALLQGNTIGTSGVAQSGSRLGLGIILDVRGNETAQVTMHQNTIQRTELNGIQVIGQIGDGDLALQVTNNIVREIEDDAGAGFGVVYGIEVTTNSGGSYDMCLDARANDSFNINGHDIRVRQATVNNTFALEGFAGTGTVATSVEAFLTTQNPLSTTNVRTGGSVVNYTAGSCTTPAPLP